MPVRRRQFSTGRLGALGLEVSSRLAGEGSPSRVSRWLRPVRGGLPACRRVIATSEAPPVRDRQRSEDWLANPKADGRNAPPVRRCHRSEGWLASLRVGDGTGPPCSAVLSGRCTPSGVRYCQARRGSGSRSLFAVVVPPCRCSFGRVCACWAEAVTGEGMVLVRAAVSGSGGLVQRGCERSPPKRRRLIPSG